MPVAGALHEDDRSERQIGCAPRGDPLPTGPSGKHRSIEQFAAEIPTGGLGLPVESTASLHEDIHITVHHPHEVIEPLLDAPAADGFLHPQPHVLVVMSGHHRSAGRGATHCFRCQLHGRHRHSLPDMGRPRPRSAPHPNPSR